MKDGAARSRSVQDHVNSIQFPGTICRIVAELLRRRIPSMHDEGVENREAMPANIAHELRAPWATVHEAATLLLDGTLGDVNDRQRKFLQIILERTEAWLLRDDALVAVPQWVSAGCPLHRKEEDIAEVLHQAVGQVQGLALMRGCDITVTTSSELTRILVDRHRVMQAVRALLAAVLSSSLPGSRIQISVVQNSKTEIEIEVRSMDAPTPFSETSRTPGDASKIERAEDNNKKLDMVRAIIEAHGGYFSASAAGRTAGSYRLTIPRKVGLISKG